MNDFRLILNDKILFRNKYFFIIEDTFPISPGHLLIISNEIKRDFFDLSIKEKLDLPLMIEKAKSIISLNYNPDGYNIGINCGRAAGQTIFHFHCHIIPRYTGDMDNPRGGIRHCINGKGYY